MQNQHEAKFRRTTIQFAASSTATTTTTTAAPTSNHKHHKSSPKAASIIMPNHRRPIFPTLVALLALSTSSINAHPTASNSYNQLNYLVNPASSDDLIAPQLDASNNDQMFLMPQAQAFQSPSHHHNSRQQQQHHFQQQPKLGACQLPPTWAGKWTQSKDKDPIRVTNTEISDKGICRDQKGDKFLFELNSSPNNKQQQQSCLVCLVINERHLNVLQYKESSCQPIPPNYININNNVNNNITSLIIDENHSLLDTICSDITGDAQLESLFRIDTPPIECPIAGQFSFTYDSCREPVSTIESCVDKKQLNFKYGACPDVSGSEYKNEVLKCYADWTEGNNYYMIGRLEHASNIQDKGKFRCFVYEKWPDGKTIQMASSSEESCYGLINPNEGPRNMRLTAKPPQSKCNFPSFIKGQSENWLSVDNSLIYMFNHDSTKYQVKETKEGNVIEEATCLQQINHSPNNHLNQQQQRSNYHHASLANQQASSRRYGDHYQAPILKTAIPSSSTVSATNQQQQYDLPTTASSSSSRNEITYLVQITKNCYTANYCAKFYKRSSGIVQIDYFPSSPGDSQCRSVHYSNPQTQILTSTNLEHQRCPFDGVYTLEAPFESDLIYDPSNIFMCPKQSILAAQCDGTTRIKIHSRCMPSRGFVKTLHCLGSWTTNGLVRFLLADDDRQRYSAWYRDTSPQLDSFANAATAQADSPVALRLQAATGTFRGYSSARTMPPQTMDAPAMQQVIIPPAPTVPSHYLQVIDLQIALITPPHIQTTRQMQIRLTKQKLCPLASTEKSAQTYPHLPGSSSSAATSHPLALSSGGACLLIVILLLNTYITRQLDIVADRRQY